ncbi:MAG: HAMP domain-containing histidine kinase [Clostridia bacterium]|nr:HAMP domain-containing histidine kinase [Clostridia bacterium]
MDTRWKKFRNNTVLKVIVFLLACTFAFLTVYSALRVISFASEYSNKEDASKLFTEYEDSAFTNSSEFIDAFSEDMTAIEMMVTEYISDENVQSGNAFANREAELKQEMEEEIARRILEKKQEVILNAATYDDDGKLKYSFSDGQNTTQYTPAYDLANDEWDRVVTIGENQYYNGFLLSAVVIDEESIRKEVEDEYRSIINSQKLEYNSQYRNDKEKLEELKNLKFAVRNRATGEVYSNMGDTVTSNTDVLSLVQKDGWSVALQSGNYSSGKNVNEKYYLDEYQGEEYYIVSMLSEKFDEKGFDIFLEFNDDAKTMQEGDSYYKMQKSYEKQLASVEAMRTSTYVCFSLFVLLTVLLCALAGKLDEQGKTKKAKIDRIYNDIHFIVTAGLLVASVGLRIEAGDSFINRYNSSFENQAVIFGISAIAAAFTAVFIEWLMSAVRHVRCHTFWKHTFLYVIFVKNAKRFRNFCKKVCRNIKSFFMFEKTKSLKTRMFKIIACYAGANVLLAVIIYILVYDRHTVRALFVLFIIVVLNLSLMVLVQKSIKALDDIMEAIIKAENGDFDLQLNIYSMPLYLQDFAKHILSLRDGIKIAVNEAIKGERMKAELITNVSHDLKTPLTSIVTYVDLLKHCELQDETATSYVKILEEKAERLKKLIEDLVEASKVSTGNVKLSLTKVNLNELAVQLTGENEEEFTALGIEMRVSIPNSAPIVQADSQKAYRVIDNLFSNIRKYAMPGTRVYVDVAADEKYGIISVKNISKNALDVPVEQLTQRFVRGDVARTSEGSGLGLSIAENLVTLQNGEFNIEIDGDLFKATVKLPLDK